MQKLTTILLLFFTISQSSCQIRNRGNDDMIIPLDLSTQRPIVEVMIGDSGPYDFIFDTGSTNSVVDEAVSKGKHSRDFLHLTR